MPSRPQVLPPKRRMRPVFLKEQSAKLIAHVLACSRMKFESLRLSDEARFLSAASNYFGIGGGPRGPRHQSFGSLSGRAGMSSTSLHRVWSVVWQSKLCASEDRSVACRVPWQQATAKRNVGAFSRLQPLATCSSDAFPRPFLDTLSRPVEGPPLTTSSRDVPLPPLLDHLAIPFSLWHLKQARLITVNLLPCFPMPSWF